MGPASPFRSAAADVEGGAMLGGGCVHACDGGLKDFMSNAWFVVGAGRSGGCAADFLERMPGAYQTNTTQ